MPDSQSARAQDAPPNSVALEVVRTGVQALCVVLGRRKAERWLREWARIAATEDSVRVLFPIKTSAERDRAAMTQAETLVWLRQVLPTLIATLPPE